MPVVHLSLYRAVSGAAVEVRTQHVEAGVPAWRDGGGQVHDWGEVSRLLGNLIPNGG